MTNNTELEKRINEAIADFNAVMDDSKVDGYQISGDKVIFTEAGKEVFTKNISELTAEQ